MSIEMKTELGVYVIYNRKTDSNRDIELLGDETLSNGLSHFGEKGGAQCRVGNETVEKAQEAMENYVWANIEGYGWTS